MKQYPALDVRAATVDLLYAALDDFSPTAIEEREDGLRAFFGTSADRDAAQRGLARDFSTSPIDVPDEDWAIRSQQNLASVTVGRITIHPTAASASHLTASHLLTNPVGTNPQSPIPNPLSVVIRPSMGFGTGHHATTRLCLDALQRVDVQGKTVLDVGTGSGVLAIAARVLGAARATGVDVDPDAVQSARENLELNPGVSGVSFIAGDLATDRLEPADVVTANLTGALLVRSASRLLDAVSLGGILILSGLMKEERDAVVRAFGAEAPVWERTEDEWVGLAVKKP